MIIGIDIGGTNTHGVLMCDGKIKSAFSTEGNKPEHAIKCFRSLRKSAGKNEVRLVLTGGGARSMKESDFRFPFVVADEIKAIGAGGVFLSGKSDVFVVSIGTGTAFVSVTEGEARHMGGTGIGGGTISGLSRLMLKLPPGKAESVAKKSAKNLDLTVRDIIGGGIGQIPAEATASNFGKADSKSRKPEIAASLFNMIGESIGVMSYFASKSVSQEGDILLCGRVVMNGIVQERAVETIRMFGGEAMIPEKAEYCAAIGAALSV